MDKKAYLTIDDGPSAYTGKLLDILKKEKIPAIFFVVGKNILKLPNSKSILLRILSEGHIIGLHSMTHNKEILYYSLNSAESFLHEMNELNKLLKNVVGYESSILRAPHGSFYNFRLGHYTKLKKSRFQYIDWNLDSRDWFFESVDDIQQQIQSELQRIGNPAELVILFHELPQTVKGLRQFIDYFKSQGYNFVQYSENEKLVVKQVKSRNEKIHYLKLIIRWHISDKVKLFKMNVGGLVSWLRK